MKAMAVTIFDRVADPEVFDGWVCDVRSAAEAAPGFVAFAASIRRDAPLDWALTDGFQHRVPGPSRDRSATSSDLRTGRRSDSGWRTHRHCRIRLPRRRFRGRSRLTTRITPNRKRHHPLLPR